MMQCIGKVGTVHRITERGDIRVQYDGASNRWTFHAGSLTKVDMSVQHVCFCFSNIQFHNIHLTEWRCCVGYVFCSLDAFSTVC